jgi:PBP1b-binding outer membrane lipoprotein LpoB
MNKILPILFSILVFAGCKSDEKKKVLYKKRKAQPKEHFFQVSKPFNTILNWSLGSRKNGCFTILTNSSQG